MITVLRRLVDDYSVTTFFKHHENKALFIDMVVAFYDIQGASYHKRMKGYREYLGYIGKLLPFHIYLANVLLYPIIWAKVKFIRTFQQKAWFKAYRNLKFKNKKANV